MAEVGLPEPGGRAPAEERRMTAMEKVAYSFPQVGINLMGVMIAQWLTFYYRPPEGDASPALVGAGVFASLMLLGRAVDGVTDPLVGHWSDRTRSRWGRRMPFIVMGTPFLALTFAGMWFPPTEAVSRANTIWLGSFLVLYWIFFTIVVGPYSALLPEIARSTRERVRLSTVMAIFTAVGTLAAGIGVGVWESAQTDGIVWFGLEIGGGIEAFAVLATAAMAVSFFLMPLGVRETPYDASKDVPPGLFAGLSVAFSNPAFRAFLGLAVFVQLGLLTFVTGLPYLCTTVLEREVAGTGIIDPGQGEAWTGTLQGILFGVAILSLPLVTVAADRWGKNRVMTWAGFTFAGALALVPISTLFPDPTVVVIAVVVLLGFPASCALVLVNAIGGDVVDYDEARTGVRREGIYSGAGALIAKTAQGLGPAIVVGLLEVFGQSRAQPLGILLVGPVSGAIVVVGMLIFMRTPVRD